MKPSDLRKEIAAASFTAPTAGCCNGFVQANMLVLPNEYAAQFEEFARANPAPIPLLETVKNGFRSKTLASGANLLNEIPSYDIIENGRRVAQVTDIEKYYQENMVFFLIGCSFSFEKKMLEEGIPLRHIEEGRNVAMYDTTIPLIPAGIFHGNMVVSMRPIRCDLIAKACVITSHFPRTHGIPVHIGKPELIGISDINSPDYGEPTAIQENELPVFWACGVTPQNVLRTIKLPFAITHSPGKMFVTDITDSEYYE